MNGVFLLTRSAKLEIQLRRNVVATWVWFGRNMLQVNIMKEVRAEDVFG